MGGMPYIVEKGPVFSVYESYLNGPLGQRLAMLANLSDPRVPSWESMPLTSAALEEAKDEFKAPPDYHPPNELENHARVHWRGDPTYNETTGEWVNLSADHTGWWSRWSGPADAILRQTFIRGIEVSIGKPHVDAEVEPGPIRPPVPPIEKPGKVARQWPIEILWICGSPTLQGWVTWRKRGEGPKDGQVTILLTTPPPYGPGQNMYMNPIPDSIDATKADNYLEGPGSQKDIDHEAGMWVIGARTTRTVPTSTFASIPVPLEPRLRDALESAELILPDSRYETVDPTIVTVRPSESDGGVLNDPRSYV